MTLPSIAEAESRAVSPAREPWSVVPQRTRRRHPRGSAPASTEESPPSSPAPSTTLSSGSSSVFEPPGDAANRGRRTRAPRIWSPGAKLEVEEVLSGGPEHNGQEEPQVTGGPRPLGAGVRLRGANDGPTNPVSHRLRWGSR
nr:uncharacterized protein LOC124212643 [Neodiprion pinetum]